MVNKNLCFSGNKLISGGEDGLVNMWDIRQKVLSHKIEPHKKSQLSRPEIGNWIGAVSTNEDWLVCTATTIFYLLLTYFCD